MAEGGSLLNCYRGLTLIVGSNPISSATLCPAGFGWQATHLGGLTTENATWAWECLPKPWRRETGAAYCQSQLSYCPSKKLKYVGGMKKLCRIFLKIIGGYIALILVLSSIYAVAPPVSTLMLARLVTLQGVKRDSVPIERINRNVLMAVISAEDDQFCTHWGINWKRMGSAVEKASDGKHAKGASTISMQVAKNLFLWPQRSYARKALEVPIAMVLELLWSKERMMEVYLSIAEWGKGIFGIEAAAQTYFHKSAKQLTQGEAALLAAALPNPLKRNPARPSAYHLGYAGTIASRMGGADLSCF